MSNRKSGNRDGVMAVGQVNDQTVQIIQAIEGVEKYTWRLIAQDGKSVTSGMVTYTSIEEAFEGAVLALIPDAEPVDYEEPTDDDWRRLETLLFGFKKGEPIKTIPRAMMAHNFLLDALRTLQAAQNVMPQDYDECIEILLEQDEYGLEPASNLQSLKELAIQQQNVMIQLCERDLETLSIFIAAFVRL